MRTKKIFNVHVLMAGHGDCIWIEYGYSGQPARVLIDGGVHRTSEQLAGKLVGVRNPDHASHELLVVTHVDDDHIAGVLPLVEDPEYAGQFAEIWFNGRKHLEKLNSLGALQGDRLTDAITTQSIPWNRAWQEESAVVPAKGNLPEKTLPGGAKITLLSPGWDQLERMAKRWDSEIRVAGLKKGIPPDQPSDVPGLEPMGALHPEISVLLKEPFEPDASPANGSSIAMLFEYENASILLGADAHPDILANSLRRLANGKKLIVDVFKLPHHGSKKNVTPEILEMVSAKKYVFSSDGKIHRHPDQAAVARVIHSAPPGAVMVFNCRTKFNSVWDSPSLKKKHQYQTEYGNDNDGVEIELL